MRSERSDLRKQKDGRDQKSPPSPPRQQLFKYILDVNGPEVALGGNMLHMINYWKSIVCSCHSEWLVIEIMVYLIQQTNDSYQDIHFCFYYCAINISDYSFYSRNASDQYCKEAAHIPFVQYAM